jgi:hypothetical protein
VDYRPTDGGEIFSLISVKGLIELRATVRLEGLGQLKNLMTSSVIESETL